MIRRSVNTSQMYEHLLGLKGSSKVCILCKKEKPLSEYGKRDESKDGKDSHCSKCHAERQARYQAKKKQNFFI